MSEFNKDCYRTPRYVFNALNRKYRFDVDACASADNALCEKYFTENLDITKTEICDVIGGRINFFHPVTCEEVKGNNKGSMIVVFDPNSQSQIQTGVTLDFLKSRGAQ